jgi:hypothetical protein
MRFWSEIGASISTRSGRPSLRETAQNEAAKQFGLTEFQRKQLLVRERHQPIADGINIAGLPNLNQDDVRTAP